MTVSLTHLGEVAITGMANEMGDRFLDLCGLADYADLASVSGGQQLAYAEVRLLPYAGIAFDGAHRIDMVCTLSGNRGAAFEIKLSETRLTKWRIDEEWLSGCALSHRGKRFKGNMMSILERTFPESVPQDDLRAEHVAGETVSLLTEWYVITRLSVLESWEGPGRPGFSHHVHFLHFERIVQEYGGKVRFNSLISELLTFDFYDVWLSHV